MKYDTYQYIYPPRAQNKIHPKDIGKYDTGEFVAQPKYNGDCCVVAIWCEEIIISNRHNEVKNHVHESIDFKALTGICKGWLVLAGEMLDKAKKDEHGQVIKGFVIWDILVLNGCYLITSTLRQRIDVLDSIFKTSGMMVGADGIKQYDHLLFTEYSGIYRAPTYSKDFVALYNDLVKTDLYEGVILKKINAKLEVGFSSKNNHSWQLKVRKPTRMYAF
jgi:hypothetical protein